MELNTICKSCISTLKTLYEFHLLAVSSQQKLLEASELKCQENVLETKGIEFLIVDEKPENIQDGPSGTDGLHQESSDLSDTSESLLINTKFNCEFCSKNYKRESNLQQHIEKHHQHDTVTIADSFSDILERNCKLCGERFTNYYLYNDHTRESSCVSPDKPACRFCNEIFTTISKLKNHIKNRHLNGRQHVCPICFKSFKNVSNRNSHLHSHNADNTISCPICSQGFKSVLYLRKHQKAIHTKVENACQICDRKFDTQQKFDYHLKSHASVKRYKCAHPDCDKSFMQSHHLANHKTTHTGESKFLCFKCGKEFKQDCNLKAHLKAHEADGRRLFTCDYLDCGKTFRISSAFRSHQKVHENDNQCQCPECGKTFKQRSSFRVHFQTHFRDPENRPYKCNQSGCNRSFFQERSIKYHNSVAHGIGQLIVKKKSTSTYFCDYCKQTFRLHSLLKRHLLVHIEEEKLSRKHKCGKCESSFKRPEHLRLHVNSVHLKIKPHKCEHVGCDRSFAQIGDRNVHMKIHFDEKPHVCGICQKSFRLAKGLRAHEKTHYRKGHELQSQEDLKFPEAPIYFATNEQQTAQVLIVMTTTAD